MRLKMLNCSFETLRENVDERERDREREVKRLVGHRERGAMAA